MYESIFDKIQNKATRSTNMDDILFNDPPHKMVPPHLEATVLQSAAHRKTFLLVVEEERTGIQDCKNYKCQVIRKEIYSYQLR